MGRTNPTFRTVVDATERRWGDYRRALRHRDVEHFDRLFGHVRAHADAASLLNHDEPLFPMLVSVALEQEKRMAELERRVEALEAGSERSDRGANERSVETSDERSPETADEHTTGDG